MFKNKLLSEFKGKINKKNIYKCIFLKNQLLEVICKKKNVEKNYTVIFFK